MVIELTDVFTSQAYPNLNRDKRKSLEAERISKISDNAQTVKLADLYSNTKSIVQDDPKFAITYLKEKHRMMKGLIRGNPILYAKVLKQLKDSIDLLGVIV